VASSAAFATPIQSYTGQATEASKSSPTTDPPWGMSGASAPPSALREKALVRNAVAALSGGVFRNAPPSASGGA
jgi:hypothetical protein